MIGIPPPGYNSDSTGSDEDYNNAIGAWCGNVYSDNSADITTKHEAPRHYIQVDLNDLTTVTSLKVQGLRVANGCENEPAEGDLSDL